MTEGTQPITYGSQIYFNWSKTESFFEGNSIHQFSTIVYNNLHNPHKNTIHIIIISIIHNNNSLSKWRIWISALNDFFVISTDFSSGSVFFLASANFSQFTICVCSMETFTLLKFYSKVKKFKKSNH